MLEYTQDVAIEALPGMKCAVCPDERLVFLCLADVLSGPSSLAQN